MQFHLIYGGSDRYERHKRDFFAHACATQDVTLALHDTDTLTLSDQAPLGEDDLLYRSDTRDMALTIERLLQGPSVTTFHDHWTNAFRARSASWFIHQKLGLPVIPSFPGIPSTPQEFDAVVARLGGYPIVVKVLGGSLGVGVMRLDSGKSLRSVLDYLHSRNARILLRQYIPHEYYVRAVVVGRRVVASHAAYNMDGEFRTNAGDDKGQRRRATTLSDEVQALAVRAVHVLGIETGGVDLLLADGDKAYIAEVNFPNNFTVTQRVTGVDIASAMLRHLRSKHDAQQQKGREAETLGGSGVGLAE